MKTNLATHIILLRGVMPTGKNKVPMAEFRAILGKAGFEEVRTYIQTGNAIIKSALKPSEVGELVQRSLKETIGVDLVVVVRTVSKFEDIMARNPFLKEDTTSVYFTLLAKKPETAALKSFASLDYSPEKVEVKGDVVYTLYATKYSDSKLNNNVIERKLGVSATTRNFNTMTHLLELAKNGEEHS